MIRVVVILCCLAIVLGQTSDSSSSTSGCVTHRNRELNNSRSNQGINAGRLIPECDAEGNYQGLQCHPPSTNGQRFCQCWEKDGTIITSPSRRIKACECLLQRNRNSGGGSTRRLVGAFVPRCKTDGNFESRQCHGSSGHCWCVDANGTQVGERTRNATALTC